MLYSKPLSNATPASLGAPGGAKAGRVMRGVPLAGAPGVGGAPGAAPDFSSLMALTPKAGGFGAASNPPAGIGGGAAKGAAGTGQGPMPGQAQAGKGASPEEAMKQGATQNNMGLNQTKAMATLAKVMQDSAKPLAALNSAGGVNGLNPLRLPSSFQRPKGLEGAETDLRVRSHRKKEKPQERMAELVGKAMDFVGLRAGQKTGAASSASSGAPTMNSSADRDADTALGQLAARFESGKDGIAAIGYDRHGGTSYGKYQISSRAGTMKSFVEFLKSEEPDFAKRLEAAGPSNTGGKSGRMPVVWKEIAEQHPDRFETLQERFIHASHFEPAVQSVAEKTGLSVAGMPEALKEVLFSTAVQHGPAGASRIVSRAVDQVGRDKLDLTKNSAESVKKAGEALIRRIYSMRSDQFGSSTESVQAAVKSRLRQEMGMAIDMLRKETAMA